MAEAGLWLLGGISTPGNAPPADLSRRARGPRAGGQAAERAVRVGSAGCPECVRGAAYIYTPNKIITLLSEGESQ